MAAGEGDLEESSSWGDTFISGVILGRGSREENRRAKGIGGEPEEYEHRGAKGKWQGRRGREGGGSQRCPVSGEMSRMWTEDIQPFNHPSATTGLGWP